MRVTSSCRHTSREILAASNLLRLFSRRLQRYEKVRSAAMTWMLVVRRVGVVKDVARMIGEEVWSSREDVAWE